MVDTDRSLSLHNRSGRRCVYRVQPVSSVRLRAAEAGGAPGLADFAQFHDLRADTAALAPRTSGTRVQCHHHAAFDLGDGDVRVFREFLRRPADCRGLVRKPPVHRRAGANQDGPAGEILPFADPGLQRRVGVRDALRQKMDFRACGHRYSRTSPASFRYNRSIHPGNHPGHGVFRQGVQQQLHPDRGSAEDQGRLRHQTNRGRRPGHPT